MPGTIFSRQTMKNRDWKEAWSHVQGNHTVRPGHVREQARRHGAREGRADRQRDARRFRRTRSPTPRDTSVPADGGRPVGWESVEIILGCLWVPRGETRVIGRFPKNRKPWNKAKNSWLGLSCEVRMMMVVMVPSVSWA